MSYEFVVVGAVRVSVVAERVIADREAEADVLPPPILKNELTILSVSVSIPGNLLLKDDEKVVGAGENDASSCRSSLRVEGGRLVGGMILDGGRSIGSLATEGVYIVGACVKSSSSSSSYPTLGAIVGRLIIDLSLCLTDEDDDDPSSNLTTVRLGGATTTVGTISYNKYKSLLTLLHILPNPNSSHNGVAISANTIPKHVHITTNTKRATLSVSRKSMKRRRK